jgi:hypothetical protein
MFHIVVLDLQLPETKRLPAPEGIQLGLDLFEKARQRIVFPIPALLIISGHVGKTEQTTLQQTARDSFYYGQMLVKGDLDLLEKELRIALERVIRYCGVGVHVRDSALARFPTISPEEEDLLRRCVLQTSGAVGFDLSWWSADIGQSSGRSTKVLLGRYILQDGQGVSRPQFVKLFPSSLAETVYDSARTLEKKLSHIKVAGTQQGTSRAVLITEKIGGGIARPIGIDDFLSVTRSTDDVTRVVAQIGAQLNELGESSTQSAQMKSLLWPFHDIERIRQQWDASGGPKIVAGMSADPITVFSELSGDTQIIRFDEQSLVHGDLHIMNIAIDQNSAGPSAYIFDAASSVGRCPKGRDFALLEVSAILHQDFGADQIPALIDVLYHAKPATDSSVARVINTIKFVSAIRKCVLDVGVDDVLYRTLVFDQSVIQLGGLAFGPSGNKVRRPEFVPTVVAAISEWLVRARPTSSPPTDRQSPSV